MIKESRRGFFYIQDHIGEYKVFSLSKGTAGLRQVYSVDEESKIILKGYLPYLEDKLAVLDEYKINYAFVKGKNCALNALQHVGNRFVLSMDLSDFFDTVSSTHLSGLVAQEIIDSCLIEGAPRQGLPTSPLIANIALLPCDLNIIKTLKSMNISCVYTRYADDLIFSFDDKKNFGKIKTIVTQVVESKGFKINSRKTSMQDSKNGRVIINGIAVDSNGIHATRKTKKRLRAALHQLNFRSARGLNEWSKCKLPRELVI